MANQPEGVYCVYDQISIYFCKFVGTVVVNIWIMHRLWIKIKFVSHFLMVEKYAVIYIPGIKCFLVQRSVTV